MSKRIFISAVGAVGGGIAYLLGGWTADMITLLIFMGIDIIAGLMVAAVFQKSGKTQNGAAESRAMFKGLCRKGVMLLFIIVAQRLDMAIGVDYIRTAVIIGFITNEGLSIIENAGLMGVPLPSVITKALEVLKGKGEENENSD